MAYWEGGNRHFDDAGFSEMSKLVEHDVIGLGLGVVTSSPPLVFFTRPAPIIFFRLFFSCRVPCLISLSATFHRRLKNILNKFQYVRVGHIANPTMGRCSLVSPRIDLKVLLN